MSLPSHVISHMYTICLRNQQVCRRAKIDFLLRSPSRAPNHLIVIHSIFPHTATAEKLTPTHPKKKNNNNNEWEMMFHSHCYLSFPFQMIQPTHNWFCFKVPVLRTVSCNCYSLNLSSYSFWWFENYNEGGGFWILDVSIRNTRRCRLSYNALENSIFPHIATAEKITAK